jgi:branched-chain amino acid transport system ATP-binding protein
MLLEVRGINTFYGISHILFDVYIEIDEGEVVCILGRNGVGKTTTLKSIMGLASPHSGSIIFNGIEIMGKQPFEIAQLGLGFVPEDRIIFPNLSVRENLEMGIKRKGKGHWTFERVYEMFPILKTREGQMGGTLSGGEQQMLTIARTLMGNPRLLLLDEPSEGLAPLIIKEIENRVRRLKTEGMPIILSEQNASFTLRFSDRAYFLEKGKVSWKGEVNELKERPEIMKTYLGI